MNKSIIVSMLTMLVGVAWQDNYASVEQGDKDLGMADRHMDVDRGDTLAEPDPAIVELSKTILSRRYLMEGYTKVNSERYLSEVANDRYLDVYIDNENLSSYSAIDPNLEGSLSEVQPGAAIIREVWLPSNELEKYTVMIKMERGYFPEGGDFLYGTINLDGTIENSGKLQECALCHEPRASDGYLFGVPAQYKSEQPNADKDVESSLAAIAREVVAQELYLGFGFQKLNTVSYPSALNAEQLIDVYVSNSGVPSYLRIDPDQKNSHESLPEQTTIVRVVKDQEGVFEKYTVMVKAPLGYFPEGGNFYYAVLDIDGNPVVDDDNQELQGKLAECGGCHLSRRGDGYLFGVTEEVKTR